MLETARRTILFTGGTGSQTALAAHFQMDSRNGRRLAWMSPRNLPARSGAPYIHLMSEPVSWLMLSMQLPSRPAYARVKIWRQLREAGAVSSAGGVYFLPGEPQHREVFEAALRSAVTSGGEAIILSGVVLEGSEDPATLFRLARTTDYESWIATAHDLMKSDVKGTEVARMQRRLHRIRAIEFIDSGAFGRAEKTMLALTEASLRHPSVARAEPGRAYRGRELHGRVWVTRRKIGVDRIASAWLIRRFIDPRPRFRFVDPDRYVHQRRELRFDMANGEFTHEEDRCSFETLLYRTDLPIDHGLTELGKIVHQLDIDDDRYDHPAAAGLSEAIVDICSKFQRDDDRLEAGSQILDEMHNVLARIEAKAAF